MTDVRTLLHDLAAEAPRGHGEDTADRVVELHRAQDRRRLRRAGVAAAIAVVVAAVPALVPRSSPADTAASAVGAAEGRSLFDVPTRGSLADDQDVLAAAGAASWDDGIAGNEVGRILDPAPADRRVAFVGAVPDGQVWALVLGRTGTQLAYAWFVDVDPTDGIDLQLATAPMRTAAGLPLGLVDVAANRGPLVVVALPGQGVTLLPADGQDPSPPDVRSAEVGDGFLVADVATADGSLPGFQLDDGPVGSGPVRQLDQVDTSQPLGTALFTSRVLGARIDPVVGPAVQACLQAAGWVVSVAADGTLGYADPLTIADLVDLDDALASCLAQAEAGTTAASASSAVDGD